MKRLLFLALSTLCTANFAQVPDYVPTDGLVAWYPFDGDGQDAGDNGLHGQVMGATGALDRFQSSNGALFFDGQNDFVSVQDNALFEEMTTSFTLSIWIKNVTWPEANWLYYMSKADWYGQPPFSGSFVLRAGADGGGGFGYNAVIETTGGDAGVGAPDPLYEGWEHVACRFDGDNIQIFRNGVLAGSNSTSGGVMLSNDADLTIGSANNGQTHHALATLDDIGIWSRSLSEEEILNLYTTTPPPLLGCTDASACNFEEDASEDDGSCQYLEVNAEELCTLVVGALVEIDLTPFEGMSFAEDVIEIEGAQFLGEFDGTNYFLTTSDLTPQDWDALEAQIAPFSGHLVDIHSEEENDFIVNSVFSVFGGSAAWIGFTDVDSEGTWVWRSGAPVTYTAWNTGEPNNSGNEHWAIMHEANHPLPGSWNDLPITSQFPAIFEIPSDALEFVWSNGESGLSTQFYSADGSEDVTLFDDGIALCSTTFELATSTECNDEMACNYHAEDQCNSGCIYPLVPGDCALGAGACTQGMEWDIETQTCVIINPADINLDGCVQLNDLLDLLSAYGNCAAEESAWQCGETLEYQGYDYATVQIGEQCWFAENLRAENDRDGGAIESIVDDGEWTSTSSGAWCSPGPEHRVAFGLLYNGHAVLMETSLCPSGWEVPSKEEWQSLASLAGGEAVAGFALKSMSGWPIDSNGNDSLGFTGLPAGTRNHDTGLFDEVGTHAYFHSSTSSGSEQAWRHKLFPDANNLGGSNRNLNHGFSVRCIKNAE